jgi:hypothetical protein
VGELGIRGVGGGKMIFSKAAQNHCLYAEKKLGFSFSFFSDKTPWSAQFGVFRYRLPVVFYTQN